MVWRDAAKAGRLSLAVLAGLACIQWSYTDLWQPWIRWRTALGLTGTTPMPTKTGNGIGWLQRKPRTYSSTSPSWYATILAIRRGRSGTTSSARLVRAGGYLWSSRSDGHSYE